MFSAAELSDYLLTYTVIYGSPLIFLVVLIGAMGIPMPTTFLVLAAGAFVHQGVLDVYTVFVTALVGAMLGDSISYWIGHSAKKFTLTRFGDLKIWQKAQENLHRRGGIAIYLTRWLFTPLALPTNLVAGSAGYAFPRFILFGVAGQVTWLLLFGSLGYTFSSRLEGMNELISNFSGVLMGIVLFVMGLFVVRRKKRQHRIEG